MVVTILLLLQSRTIGQARTFKTLQSKSATTDHQLGQFLHEKRTPGVIAVLGNLREVGGKSRAYFCWTNEHDQLVHNAC
jgi:hypothetical protein